MGAVAIVAAMLIFAGVMAVIVSAVAAHDAKSLRWGGIAAIVVGVVGFVFLVFAL